MKTLFQHSDILIKDSDKYRVLHNAYLAVTDDTITYIGTTKPQEIFDSIKDYSGKMLLPGLYNCHTHSPMVLFRGIGNDVPLQTWLFEHIFPLESKLTEQQVLTASRLAMMEMIASGTVSFTDMYFFPEFTANAVIEIGMKANLTKHIQFTDKYPNAVQDSIRFIQEYSNLADGRIKTDYSIHSLYTCDKDTAAQYTAICNEANGRMHIHLSETETEYTNCLQQNGITPTQWFDSIGALNENTTAAHCVVLSDDDISCLAQRRVNIVHCPTSNLKLGSGFAPIPELAQAGCAITLGTDSAASNNNLNMFEEIHLASILHKGRLKDPTNLCTDTVLDMATTHAAKAQGRTACGQLKCGYMADIIAIDLNKPHLLSAQGTEKALLTYSAGGGDVCMTMVNGKILYENGEFFTIDKEKVFCEMREILK